MYEPKFLGPNVPPVRIEPKFVGHVLGKICDRCKRDMVLLADWNSLTAKEKRAFQKDFAPIGSRGLCRSCYEHLRAADPDALLDYARKTVPFEQFVEDVAAYRRRTTNHRKLAQLMGMSFTAYEKALTRAKKEGLL